MSEPFIAEIRIFASNFAPRNWAFCDGTLLPIAQNTALFSLVGITYGGDGRTTFGLPDLRGRAPMGPGRGPGLTERRLGENGGSERVALQASELPPHTHTVRGTAFPGTHFTPSGASSLSRTVGTNTAYATAAPDIAMDPRAVSDTGSGDPHNNLQPYLGLNFIIALVGLFPPRP